MQMSFLLQLMAMKMNLASIWMHLWRCRKMWEKCWPQFQTLVPQGLGHQSFFCHQDIIKWCLSLISSLHEPSFNFKIQYRIFSLSESSPTAGTSFPQRCPAHHSFFKRFVAFTTANLSIGGFNGFTTANLTIAGFVGFTTANLPNAGFFGFITANPLIAGTTNSLRYLIMVSLLSASLSLSSLCRGKTRSMLGCASER